MITETFYLVELYLDLIIVNSKTLPFLSPSSILFTLKIKMSVHIYHRKSKEIKSVYKE